MKTLNGSSNITVALFVLIGTIMNVSVRAESGTEYSFATIWKLVRERAPEIRAANHDLEGARIYEQRTSRHWYPRAFVEGRVFSTNDPALTFMSLLGQRQINAGDFAPQALNQPGSRVFERGTLGLDLPLFEGGSKAAAAHAAAIMAEAKSFELRSSEVAKYAEIANDYSSLLSLQRQRSELQKMSESVVQTLSQYKIGSKSNPIGYSGLLGLKTLSNRLEGLLADNSAKVSALRERIRILAIDLPENWIPQSQTVKAFVAEHLAPTNGANPNSDTPATVRAMNLVASSLEEAKAAERARFLPKVGLFGTGDLYGGSRGTATSMTGGAYAQWDLLSAPSFGAVGQAEHTAAAAQARADAVSERAQIERAGARLSAEALEKNLTLMEASSKLLEEQTATARSLFRNGSINALQLVEVLARRVDLTVSRAEAELGLAQARVAMLVNSGAEGVLYEK